MKKQKQICKCPECGKIVSAKIPKGGDGSMWVPYVHKDNAGQLCSGRFEECKLITVIEYPPLTMPDQKEQTAIMQLIEKYKALPTPSGVFTRKLIEAVIADATSLLPVEKEQIVDAHEDGLYRNQSSEEYYENKFTQ